MADAQKLNSAQLKAQANMNFLANSYLAKKAMNVQSGNTFSQGSQLTFTSPIVPGWGVMMRIYYNLTVNITMGGGSAALNAGCPYNMFNWVDVDFAGQNHRHHGGYLLKVLQQSYRGLLDLDASKAYASAIISNSLPVVNGANTWVGYMDVPLQIEAEDVAGLVPLGDSAAPLTLRLTCASSFFGSDPYTNVVALAGGATGTVTGTISAVIQYRYGQSVHSPMIRPDAPKIGTFAKIVEMNTNISANNAFMITELRQPYPHIKVCQTIVVPTAATKFCSASDVGGLKFELDPNTVMYDYSSSGAGNFGKLVDQRILYHGDLDEGVYLWDFIAGSNPEVPNGLNTPNLGNYNAAQTEILFGGTLAGSNNRIITAAMFLEPLPY